MADAIHTTGFLADTFREGIPDTVDWDAVALDPGTPDDFVERFFVPVSLAARTVGMDRATMRERTALMLKDPACETTATALLDSFHTAAAALRALAELLDAAGSRILVSLEYSSRTH